MHEQKPKSDRPNVPLGYTNTGTFRAKAFRKATRVQALQLEVKSLKQLAQLQKVSIDNFTAFSQELIKRLAEIGLVMKYDKKGNTITFESIKK